MSGSFDTHIPSCSNLLDILQPSLNHPTYQFLLKSRQSKFPLTNNFSGLIGERLRTETSTYLADNIPLI